MTRPSSDSDPACLAAFEAVFRNARSVMLLVDAKDWTIFDANRAAERFYGLSREELRTRTLDRISGVTREVWEEEERQHSGPPEGLPAERSHKTADGRVRVMRARK
jgi:PAS domain S-box-containing protein